MRITRGLTLLAYTLVFAAGLTIGCRPSPSADTANTGSESGSGKGGAHAHDHDHDHDHDHEEGPHGGHLLALEAEGGSQSYQAEWLHDDQHGIITVFLLEGDQPLAADQSPESISIEIRTGNNPMTYELPATPSEEDPSDIAYVIEEPALVTALQVIVEGQEPTLSATIGGTTYVGTFEKHDHHHHH